MINSTKILNDPDLTLRRHADMRDVVNPILIAKAKANDADALFQIGIIALRNGRLGFAWVFLKKSAEL